jgi:hypothetical protein
MTGFECKRQAALDKLVQVTEELGLYEDKPAQEPFGWYSAQEDEFMLDKILKEHERLNSYTHKNGKFDLALYTTTQPRPWIGLTDEEKSDIWCVVTGREFVTEETHVYADAIEAKLRSKNHGSW